MFSAHAIGHPKFDLFFPSNNSQVQWKSNYKYLGYIVCTNLGWGKFILHMETKIRKCVSLNRRLTLFNAFVLPIFSWIFPIFPLFTSIQQMHPSHFYFYCLRRVLFRLDINSEIFLFCLDAPSLEDRCFNYWNKFLICLADNADGTALLEQVNLSFFRDSWLNKDFALVGMRRNKCLVPRKSLFEIILSWMSSTPLNSSVPYFEINDFEMLQFFPDTFL